MHHWTFRLIVFLYNVDSGRNKNVNQFLARCNCNIHLVETRMKMEQEDILYTRSVVWHWTYMEMRMLGLLGMKNFKFWNRKKKTQEVRHLFLMSCLRNYVSVVFWLFQSNGFSLGLESKWGEQNSIFNFFRDCKSEVPSSWLCTSNETVIIAGFFIPKLFLNNVFLLIMEIWIRLSP